MDSAGRLVVCYPQVSAGSENRSTDYANSVLVLSHPLPSSLHIVCSINLKSVLPLNSMSNILSDLRTDHFHSSGRFSIKIWLLLSVTTPSYLPETECMPDSRSCETLELVVSLISSCVRAPRIADTVRTCHGTWLSSKVTFTGGKSKS